MEPKRGVTRPAVVLDAQRGNPHAQAQLLKENRPLVYTVLRKWGITPQSIGKDAYYDFIGEIELHILQTTLPGYDLEGSTVWGTWLYNSINNFIDDIVYKKGRRNPMREELTAPTQSLSEPVSGEEGSRTLEEVTPDINTMGINPQIELMLESVKQQLSPVDQQILDYKILGYRAKDIAEYFQTRQVTTPRGGLYDAHMVTWRWNNIIKPLLEEIFPPNVRIPFQPQKEQYIGQQPSPYEQPAPVYRIDPDTGVRTLVPPTEFDQTIAGTLSLRRYSQVLDVLDYIRIYLLHDN